MTHKLFNKNLLLALPFIFVGCSNKTETTTAFCNHILINNKPSLSKELDAFSEISKTRTGVFVLEDGNSSMVSRAWLCENAEQSIDIQYFIFSTDNVGLIACDYLVRAADRGVKIRLLIDDILIDAAIEDVLTLNSHPNIEIKIYNPGVNLGKSIYSKVKTFVTDFRGANQRMHNKTFNVDGKVAITGGRNIADEYFDYDHHYNFRDRDVLLLGKEVNAVTKSFKEFWASPISVSVVTLVDKNTLITYTENTFKKLHEYACNPANFWPQIRKQINQLPLAFKTIKTSGEFIWVDEVQFVSDIPGKNSAKKGLGGGGLSTSKLIELVENAKHSIDIQTPYLITTELSEALFSKAIKRGVQIKILTNSLASTDNLEAFSSYQSNRENLLKTGVQIFEFKPDAAIRKTLMTGKLHKEVTNFPIFGLHAKTMVIDDSITVIGTFNLDPRSANLNTECITIINSKVISKKVLQGIEEEFKPENAWEITSAFNPDSEVNKLKRIKTWTRKIIPKEIL
jgi:phosphatidylserine/phosphatidylglycerophosphate/cardiolipin synthase-like enzyme